MFHDDKFLKRIESTQGCKLRSFKTGHWPQITQANEFLQELKSFI